jgi:hypothetical protein
VTDGHKCSASVGMVLGVSGAFVAGRSRLETSDGFGECLDGSFSILLNFLFIELIEEVFGLIVFFEGLFLFGDLFLVFGRFFFFCLGF